MGSIYPIRVSAGKIPDKGYFPPGGQDTQAGVKIPRGILTPGGQAAQWVKMNCNTTFLLKGDAPR